MYAAATTGNSADMITTTLNDIIALLSGNGSEYWTHRLLFSADVLATIVVGAGIIFETPRYSAHVHKYRLTHFTPHAQYPSATP
jgi:hypothetical protein